MTGAAGSVGVGYQVTNTQLLLNSCRIIRMTLVAAPNGKRSTQRNEWVMLGTPPPHLLTVPCCEHRDDSTVALTRCQESQTDICVG